VSKSGIFHNVNWSGGTASNTVEIGKEDSVVNWYDGSFTGTKFGYAEKYRGETVDFIDISSRCFGPQCKYKSVNGYISGSTADTQDIFDKLTIAIAHKENITSYYDSANHTWEDDMVIELISPTAIYVTGIMKNPVPEKDCTMSFSNFTGFTGNWHDGEIYSGIFYGKWGGGKYYSSTWYGQNISNYNEPEYYNGTQSNSSTFQEFEEDFVKQNVNLPPETNPFNPQNQSFHDPTYFD